MASISASISSLLRLRSSPSKSRPRRLLTIATLLPPLQASTRDPHYHYPKAVASVAAAPCPRPSAGELGLVVSEETAMTGGGGGKGGCGPRGGGGNGGGGGNANWGQGGTSMDLETLVFLIREMARITWMAAVHTPQAKVVSVCSNLETAIGFFLLLTLAAVIIIVAAPAIALVNLLHGCLEAPRKLLEYVLDVTKLMHGEGEVELCNAN